MRLLLSIFLLLSTILAKGEPTNVVVYSTETGLGNLPCWNWWYNDAICPSGMARQTSGGCSSTSATGDIILPLTMVPGVYQAYVKVVCLNSAVGATNMVVGLTAPGGTTVEKAPDDRNADAYWTILGPLTFPTATNKVTFNWRTTDGVNNIYPTKSMIALYLTTETNIVVTPDDYVQRWIVPVATDTNAPVAGNLLPNSSFEMGLDGWSLFPNTKTFFSPPNIVITNDSHSGSQAIAFPNLPVTTALASSILEMTAMPVLVRPNKAHTLSWYAKSIPAGAKVQGKILPAVITNANLGLPNQTNYQSATFILTTNWTRYSAENMILREYPSPAQYYAELAFDPTGVSSSTMIYVDSVQFEEGATASTYAPAYTHEVGIEQTQLGGSYYLEDTNTVVNVVVSGTDSAFQILTYQVSSRFFTNFITATNALVFGSGRTVIPVDCNSLPLGAFRIAAWLSNGSETEGYFSRIHRPVSLPRGQGIFGTHMEQWWGGAQLAKRRGYTFSRVFSPAGRFRWEYIEPSQDNFTFATIADQTMDMIIQEIEPFCTMYQDRADWPNRTFMKLSTPVGPGFIMGETVTQAPSNTGVVTWIGGASDPTGHALQLSLNPTIAFTVSSTITGTTSGTTATPNWVRRHGPSIPDYTNYVAKLIERYTNKFFAYEVMNEPNLDETVSGPAAGPKEYSFYAQVLRDSVRAAKAVYPDVKLVGMSGVNQTTEWQQIWDLIPDETRTNLHATSVHLYEANSFRNEQFVELSRTNNGPQVWMTEGGIFNFSQYYGSRAAWRNNGLPLLPFRDSEDFMRTWNESLELGPWNMVEAIGGGVSRHIYYDSRFYHHYGDPQAYSVQYTGIDLQEVAKPVDAAQSFVLYSLDGGKGVPRPPRTDTGVKSYCVQAPWDVPWLIIKSINTAALSSFPTRTNRLMTWSLTNGVNVQAYSAQGNLIPDYVNPSTGVVYNDVIQFGMIPVFIKGINGTTMAQMVSAYMGASFAIANPDTTAPTITICDYPKGPVGPLRNHRVRFRWLVYDEWYTTRMHFNAVDTRYRVDSQPFSTWSQESFTEYPQEATLVRKFPNPQLISGSHVFTVEARDVAGNTATNSVTVIIL